MHGQLYSGLHNNQNVDLNVDLIVILKHQELRQLILNSRDCDGNDFHPSHVLL